MAVSKVTCPECETVLRPAKPVAEGKSITCPECGHKFRVPFEELAVIEEKPRKKSSGKRKDPDKGAVKAASPPKASGNDDDDGGTYGLIKEKGEDESKAQKITYAPDTSIKDLRGPAQEAIMAPTNMLILTAALGFFGWLGLLIALLIPTLLPLSDEEGRANNMKNIPIISGGIGNPTRTSESKEPTQQGESEIQTALSQIQQTIDNSKKASNKVDPDEFRVLVLFGYDLAWISNLEPGVQVVAFLPLILGMLYCGGVIMGAVSAQNMESRSLGVVSASMVIVPITIAGLASLVAIFLGFLVNMVADADTAFYLQTVIFIIASLLAAGVGAWNITVLNQAFVVSGFEYVPST